jgi:hypothetical protein
MISASHRKRDSREALVRWLRDRSSGGRTSHSGTFDCRFPILDCMPFPRFSIESRQSKSPKILAGNILQCFSVAVARHGLNRIRLQLAIYFCLYRRSLPENTAGGRTRFQGEILAQKFRKKTICRLRAVLSRIASLGDEHDAIIAVWLHGLRQNEGEE